MELKEYYKIIKNNLSILLTTLVIVVAVAYAWSVRQAELYNAEALLNIGRIDNQNSADYRYDQFYRVQADEKFGKNLSEWLKYPGVVSEIVDRSGISNSEKSALRLAQGFQAETISPESVRVKFSYANQDDAKNILTAIGAVLIEKTDELNSQARDQTWFKVALTNPIVLKNTQDLRINLALAAIAGLFLGSIFALFKHYISE